jgi:hypothetical protein
MIKIIGGNHEQEIFFPVLLAILMALALTSTVLAAEDEHPEERWRTRGVGLVMGVADGQITVQNPRVRPIPDGG